MAISFVESLGTSTSNPAYTSHRFGLGISSRVSALETVADAVYRANYRGVFVVLLNAFSELRDVLVKCAAIRHVVQAPTLVEKRFTIHGLTLMSVEQFEDLDVAEAEFDGFAFPACAKLRGEYVQVAHLEGFIPGRVAVACGYEPGNPLACADESRTKLESDRG